MTMMNDADTVSKSDINPGTVRNGKTIRRWSVSDTRPLVTGSIKGSYLAYVTRISYTDGSFEYVWSY